MTEGSFEPQTGAFEVIRSCAVHEGIDPELLTPADIREGMTAVLSILIPEPEFEGQTVAWPIPRLARRSKPLWLSSFSAI